MQSTPTSRRGFLNHGAALAALALVGAAPLRASAQTAGSLRILCTAPAGSIPDTVARRYADQLAARYPGGVVVDNRPGAAGRLAVAALKQADADGATMLLAQGAVATVYPYLYANLAYNAVADLKPVSIAAEATLALAVGPAVPDSVATLRDFIEWTRAHPKLANYGSPGAGTLPHLLSALLAAEAKVDWQHVAYPGGPQAIGDLLGGRLTSLILPEGLLRQHHVTGKLRVLATSGSARSEFMPGVATFVEQGYPALVVREWFAMFMPGPTPQAAVDRASEQIRQAAAGPAVSGVLRDIGMLAVASTPAQMAERIAVEQRYWQRVIGTTGIRAE
jgi:tripartite-type tricarboxylate transporter receptor subunit TctC